MRAQQHRVEHRGIERTFMSETQWKKWECIVCGFVYQEELGLPDEDIAPGTRWQDIPEDWCCPDCGVSKEDFEMVEV